jgi:hypothetical protein
MSRGQPRTTPAADSRTGRGPSLRPSSCPEGGTGGTAGDRRGDEPPGVSRRKTATGTRDLACPRCRGRAERDGCSATPGLRSARSGERSRSGLGSVYGVGRLLDPACGPEPSTSPRRSIPAADAAKHGRYVLLPIRASGGVVRPGRRRPRARGLAVAQSRGARWRSQPTPCDSGPLAPACRRRRGLSGQAVGEAAGRADAVRPGCR